MVDGVEKKLINNNIIMDTCYWNNSYITTINVLLVTCPLCWGIYELRKLTKLLQTYKTTIDKLEPKVFSMQTLIDNVSKEQVLKGNCTIFLELFF